MMNLFYQSVECSHGWFFIVLESKCTWHSTAIIYLKQIYLMPLSQVSHSLFYDVDSSYFIHVNKSDTKLKICHFAFHFFIAKEVKKKFCPGAGDGHHKRLPVCVWRDDGLHLQHRSTQTRPHHTRVDSSQTEQPSRWPAGGAVSDLWRPELKPVIWISTFTAIDPDLSNLDGTNLSLVHNIGS